MRARLPTNSRGGPLAPLLSARYFDFTPSLAQHVAAASLVISHAGSGSIFESLSAGKALVVVPNPLLMDNHQAELGSHLKAMGVVVGRGRGGVGWGGVGRGEGRGRTGAPLAGPGPLARRGVAALLLLVPLKTPETALRARGRPLPPPKPAAPPGVRVPRQHHRRRAATRSAGAQALSQGRRLWRSHRD
jgi:hypothetical protein